MEKIRLGKITLCVNAQRGGVHILSPEEDKLVVEQLCQEIRKEWENKQLSILGFELVSYQRGCLLTNFEIYVNLAALGAAGVAVQKFVKDYPALREGVIAIFKDINTVLNSATKKRHTTCIYHVELPVEVELNTIRKNEDRLKDKE